ncbi:hypothetical protein D9M70_483130 [compost metagenome]
MSAGLIYSVLDGRQEDEPIDQPQQFLKEGPTAQRTVLAIQALQSRPQLAVGGVREKACAKSTQGFGHLVAQVRPYGDAGFQAHRSPAFPHTVGGLSWRAAKSARMRQQPKRREVGVELFGKERFEVNFDVSRASKTRIVAQDAQRQAVRDDGPQGGIGGIKGLLGQHVGAASTNFARVRAGLSETLRRRIQRPVMCGKDQGHTTALGGMANGVAVATALDSRTASNI